MFVMNRCVFLALVLVFGRSESPNRIRNSFRGEWVVVDFHTPEAKEDRAAASEAAISFGRNLVAAIPGEQYEDFEYTLEPTQSPKHLDLTYTASNGKRLTVRAIYELRDSDRLRICLGSPPVVMKDDKVEYVESVRPTAFEPKTGALISYRRKTSEDK